ncbi:MAG: DUF4260 domain-containing protein [Myxococcales bacterium]|nr:DUF4260 domain-containing protein [Myxococcales bacterium]
MNVLTTLRALQPTAAPAEAERSTSDATASTAVNGGPRVVLRLEGALVLAAGTLAYASLGAGWGLFALLFFTPDLTFLGYLAGPRVGAIAYNAGHSYLGPALLAGLGFAFGAPLLLSIAAIWVAHVGFDRMLGYGLKYASAFGHTHLGRVGKGA